MTLPAPNHHHPPSVGPSSASLGDLATWVGAIGTVLAFIVALILLLMSVRDRARQQARLVSTHIKYGPVGYPAGYVFQQVNDDALLFEGGVANLSGVRGAWQWTMAADAASFHWIIQNDSDEMLGRTRLVLLDEHGKPSEDELRVLAFMPARTTEELTVFRLAENAPKSPIRPRIVFEDAVGRVWFREPGSRLKRIRGPRARRKALGNSEPH